MKLLVRPRQQPRENIVPMINVVFLLLIFFLMTSTVAPVTKTQITPPNATSQVNSPKTSFLYLSKSGAIEFQGAFGDDAIGLLINSDPSKIAIAADREMSANALQDVLARLSPLGVRPVQLIVTPSSKTTP